MRRCWTARPAATPSDPWGEVARFRRQLDALEGEIEGAVERLEAEIMRTHLAMLRDPGLLCRVQQAIRECGHRAEGAVEQVLEGMAAMHARAEDAVLSERAAHLRELAMRLAAGLSEDGTSAPGTRRAEQVTGSSHCRS